MKTLCLYYTRTNTTKDAIEKLADILDADVIEYTDGKDRSGVMGYIGACVVSMKKNYPQIKIKENIDFSSYDRVIVGMPIWVEGPCVIGKAFLDQYKDQLPKDVYYLVTQMGGGNYEAKIKSMDSILGRPSAGQVSIKTKNNDYLKDVENFANIL